MARRSREDAEESILRELGGWIVYILLIIGLTYFIITFVGQRTRVSGSSMETTLQNGDNLIVDKISYRFRDPKRYDIIVFPYKYEENTYYIKRIIGMPGETVQIKNGYVYIDGERLLSDIYGNELIKDPQTAADPITLKENEYFVMGDNRNDSTDSREIGPIPKNKIQAKVSHNLTKEYHITTAHLKWFKRIIIIAAACYIIFTILGSFLFPLFRRKDEKGSDSATEEDTDSGEDSE